MPILGGFGESKPATDEIQALVDGVAEHIRAQTGVNHPQLKAVSYSSQVVAGTNFIVKVNLFLISDFVSNLFYILKIKNKFNI